MMKPFNELKLDEQRNIAELFAIWLEPYSHEVIVRVMEKREEILNNTFAMDMLNELRIREKKEQEEFKESMESYLRNFEDYKQYNPHNHVLTHSHSYRDILYDMYIRSI